MLANVLFLDNISCSCNASILLAVPARIIFDLPFLMYTLPSPFRATSEHPVLSIKKEDVTSRIRDGHYEISTKKLMEAIPEKGGVDG